MRNATLALILLLPLASCDRKTENADDSTGTTDALQTTTLPLADVVAKHLAAIGGVEAHRKQTSRKMEGTITLMGSTGTLTVTQKAPDKKHARTEMPSGLVTIEACDGTAAWQKNGGLVTRQLSGDELASKVRDARFHGTIELLNREDLRYVKTETLKGQVYHVLQSGSPTEGGPHSLYINGETHLMDQMRSPVPGLGEILIGLEDYRMVDNLQIPFSMTVSMGSNVFMTIQFESVTHGVAVDDALFAMSAE